MNYHDITHDDLKNGDGLRVVLWVSGCSHHCAGCQNPQTWDKNSGILFDDAAKQEIFAQLNQDYISGITFSGGDPLHYANAPEILTLAKEIKEKYPNKTIWLYSGYTLEEILRKDNIENLNEEHMSVCKEILNYTDVFVDGEYIEEARDTKLQWKGSKNQRVINVPETLDMEQIILHAQDYYDADKDMDELFDNLITKNAPNYKDVDLLDFAEEEGLIEDLEPCD